MSDYYTGMVMTARLETGHDLHCSIDDFQISSRHVDSLQNRALDRGGWDWCRLWLRIERQDHSECDEDGAEQRSFEHGSLLVESHLSKEATLRAARFARCVVLSSERSASAPRRRSAPSCHACRRSGQAC